MGLLILALDDGEGLEDVGHGIAGEGEVSEQILGGLLAPLLLGAEGEMKKGGVELAAELKAVFLIFSGNW